MGWGWSDRRREGGSPRMRCGLPRWAYLQIYMCACSAFLLGAVFFVDSLFIRTLRESDVQNPDENNVIDFLQSHYCTCS
eukprot:scaffold3799_cov98-Cylindrotheca_fusiformis.AAC.1